MKRAYPAFVLSVLACSTALAQPTRSKADERFQAGRKLMDAGKYDEACAAFEDSQQLDPAVTTLLNLAACREKAGELASAVAVFRVAERAATQEGTAQSKALADIAAGHVKRLEPRLSTMTVIVAREQRVDGLAIERNGVRLDPRQWDLPMPLDGGSYEIVASAPKHDTWRTKVTLAAERDTKTIYLPDLPEQTARQVKHGPTQPPGNGDGTEPTHTDGGHSIVWPIGFTVAALAAGGTAYWFSRQGDDLYEKSKVEADPARQTDLWKQANRRRYLAEGLAVAGVGCAVVAVWLFIRGSGSSDGPQVSLVPAATPEGGLVHLVGSF